MKLIIAFLFLSLTACEDERVCSIDQSSMFQIKCRGSCPTATQNCLLRWRALGSIDAWSTNGTPYRDRDTERDAELEYACQCQ